MTTVGWASLLPEDVEEDSDAEEVSDEPEEAAPEEDAVAVDDAWEDSADDSAVDAAVEAAEDRSELAGVLLSCPRTSGAVATAARRQDQAPFMIADYYDDMS